MTPLQCAPSALTTQLLHVISGPRSDPPREHRRRAREPPSFSASLLDDDAGTSVHERSLPSLGHLFFSNPPHRGPWIGPIPSPPFAVTSEDDIGRIQTWGNFRSSSSLPGSVQRHYIPPTFCVLLFRINRSLPRLGGRQEEISVFLELHIYLLLLVVVVVVRPQ